MAFINQLATFPAQMEVWEWIEKPLCELVDRLYTTGYRHTLEVELRIMESGDDLWEYDFKMFLPDFRGRGIVTIIDAAHDNLVLHSSTDIVTAE